MRKSEFFKDLKIEDEDKPRAEKALWAKGIEKHILIKEYLQAWSSKSLRYSQVATTYRYDKRIRNVLYKYISYLEEFYRAKILDNYFNKESDISWFTPINKFLNKGLSLNESLEALEFKTLIDIIKSISKNFNEECVFVAAHKNKNFYAFDEEKLIGGAIGFVCYSWYYLDLLFVEDAYRKKGIGSQLLKLVELFAKENFLIGVRVETWDFQALGFYQSKGYNVFGEIKDCPPGTIEYHLKKEL